MSLMIEITVTHKQERYCIPMPFKVKLILRCVHFRFWIICNYRNVNTRHFCNVYTDSAEKMSLFTTEMDKQTLILSAKIAHCLCQWHLKWGGFNVNLPIIWISITVFTSKGTRGLNDSRTQILSRMSSLTVSNRYILHVELLSDL